MAVGVINDFPGNLKDTMITMIMHILVLGESAVSLVATRFLRWRVETDPREMMTVRS
jgi:hypothetical protein